MRLKLYKLYRERIAIVNFYFELVNDIFLRYYNMGWNKGRIEGDIMENSFLQSIVDYFNDRENGTVLQTPDFSIVHNVLEFSDLIVQISSIASVSVAKPVKNKIPKWLTYAIIIGVILLALKNSVGYIILGICAFFLYCIYESNKDLGMNLIFELNSGKFLYINVEDKVFAQKVINVLRDCMNGANKPLTINFDKMNIVDSNVIIGNENQVESNTYENCE